MPTDGQETDRGAGPATRQMATEARALFDSIERGSAELSEVLREQVLEHPWAMLGAGVALGYVLGGGLTLRLSGLVLAAAGRAALANALAAASRGAAGGR